MKLVVSYCYYPLEKLADEPLFCALLESVQLLQKNKNGEKQHIAELEQAVAAQQQTVALLHQKNAEVATRCQSYETSLEGVLNSSSWKLTLPLRRLLGLFRRSH